MTDPRKMIKIGLSIAFGAAVIGLTFFQTRDLLTGPIIKIESPENGSSFAKPLITLVAVFENTTRLSVNDHQSYVDVSGRLVEDILLTEGYNVITIKATDRFGRLKTKKLQFIYKPAGTEFELGTTTEEAD